MAAGSADYTVGVKLTGDAVDLKAEVSSAESAITGLDTTVSQTSDSIVNTSGRKLKTAGKTIGTDFAASMTQGIASGDIVGSVSGIFSSLAAVGGVAAIGVGLGAALVTGLVKGAQQREADYRAAVSSLLEAGEVEAEQSARKIRKSIFDAFTFETAVKEFGGGDLQTGMEKIQQLADDTGQSFNQVADIVRGEMSPAVDGTLKTLQDMVQEEKELQQSGKGAAAAQLETADAAQVLLDHYDKINGQLNDAVDSGIKQRDYARSTAGYVGDIVGQTSAAAGQSERYAAALERADAAARLLAGRRLPSSDAMNGI
jgi:hypothetical protein